MSDNPLSTNPILAADAHARYVPWLTDVDREIGCLVRVALQRDYSFLAAFHRGLSVPEAIREAIPWLRHCNESTPSRSSPKTWRTIASRGRGRLPASSAPALLFVGRAGATISGEPAHSRSHAASPSACRKETFGPLISYSPADAPAVDPAQQRDGARSTCR